MIGPNPRFLDIPEVIIPGIFSEQSFYRWKRQYQEIGIAELRRLRRLEHGRSQVISTDNGTEFTSRAVDEWAHPNRVKLDWFRPGKPVENAYMESFTGSVPGRWLIFGNRGGIIYLRAECPPPHALWRPGIES